MLDVIIAWTKCNGPILLLYFSLITDIFQIHIYEKVKTINLEDVFVIASQCVNFIISSSATFCQSVLFDQTRKQGSW